MDLSRLIKQIYSADLFWPITVLSVGMFFLILIFTAWAIVLIPEDYFETRRPNLFERLQESSIPMAIFLIGKNLFAVVYLILGIFMLVLPGQGLLSILVALLLIDFPGKLKIERWLISRAGVLRTANWLRRTFNRKEIKL